MEAQLQNSKNELSSLSAKDLFYKYVRFLPLFLISVALALFVAFIYLRYATLVYESSGKMIIQAEDKSGSGNNAIEKALNSDNKKNIQNEIEYIQSRKLMARVVNALNLNFTYFAKGNIKELNIYRSGPFLVEAFEIADSSHGFVLKIEFENNNRFRINGDGPFTYGQVFKTAGMGVFRLVKHNPGTPAGEYKVVWQPSMDVAGGLVGSLGVAPKAGTGILTLSLRSTNPQLAADVVNELMRQYQEATKEDKNLTTQNQLSFIDARVDTVSKQLDSINDLRVSLIKRYNLIDPATQSANYFSRIEQSNTELQRLSQQMGTAVQIEAYMQRGRSSYTTVPSSLGLEDPTLNALVQQYNEAQIARKTLRENAPEGNVLVQQQNTLIDRLSNSILENLKNIRSSYGSAMGSFRSSMGAAQSRVKMLPEEQRQLDEVTRQLETKMGIFKGLLEKREESAIKLASTISDIKVLQDAGPNLMPVQPNSKSIRITAILIGLLLPALFIFVLELMNDKVTTRNDIERITTAAIIGEVGHSYGKNNLVATSTSRSVVAEQFRIIRSNLQYVLNNTHKPVVLVTSSFSGEGKSFISTNVGAVHALAGKRTIILEFDIRKPKILSHLNMAKKPGLTNWMLGKVSIESLPVPVDGVENLFVLPCGPVPPNPSELLLDIKLTELFDFLKANFDIVIMDTAPVGMVGDALTLSKFASSTLYIVRQGHTYKKQIGLVDEFYRDGKLPKVSIILNDVKLRSGYGYYGYGRYGYGYGYGSGYFDDDETPPPTMLRRWFGWLDTKSWNKKKKRKKTTA